MKTDVLKREYIDQICNIEQMSFSSPWTRDAFEHEIDNSFARYVVFLDGDTVVGYGGYWIIIDEAHINNIAVHTQYRGMGIGGRILSQMESNAKKENAVAITLEVRPSNVIAIKMYETAGFVLEGRRKKYYGDEDALIYWKRYAD